MNLLSLNNILSKCDHVSDSVDVQYFKAIIDRKTKRIMNSHDFNEKYSESKEK